MDEDDFRQMIREEITYAQGVTRKVSGKRTTAKKTMEFTKIFSLVIIAAILFTWSVAWATWVFKGEYPQDLLDYIKTAIPVIVGYYAKSGLENYTKIKGSSEGQEGRDA